MTSRSEFERYQAFMIGYVNRINQSTLGVTIGGIRIGTAKYSRLAQINLHTRIITFSRFAIENVPERGRRYLVIHELAHVNEANHTKRFWEMVARYEPDYQKIGHELDRAFKRNVKLHQAQQRELLKIGDSSNLERSNDWSEWANRLIQKEADGQPILLPQSAQEEDADGQFECMGNDFDVWDGASFGALEGGSEDKFDTIFSGASLE